MNTNHSTERQNCQITPFNFFVAQNHNENWSVRMVLIDNTPWFMAKDVGSALGIENVRGLLGHFPESEKRFQKTPTAGGWRESVIVNEHGLYRFIFHSRSQKPQVERFKDWALNDLLPQFLETYSIPQDRKAFAVSDTPPSVQDRLRHFIKSLRKGKEGVK